MALPARTQTLRYLLVAASLLGVLLVTHIALQESVNDFAYGCSGVAGGGEADTGCGDVTSSAWATVPGLGVKQTTMGFLFYGLMALLRLGYVVVRDDKMRLGAFALSTVGVAYSAFLVFLQATQIGAFCILCLGSALLTLVLFLLHMTEHRRLGAAISDAPARRAKAERTGLAALRPYAPILGAFLVLLVADVVLASSAPDAEAAETAAAAPGGPPGAALAAATPQPQPPPAAGCAYDPNLATIDDLSAFTGGPFLGNPDAPVTIVEIFDPNCPHCRDLKEELEPFVQANLDRVRFYPVAYPLRTQSVGQVVALTLAQREGKYLELIDEMFRRQDQTWGMSMLELEQAVEAVGMNPATVRGTLEDQAQLQPILEGIQSGSQAVAAAFALPDGGISVPKVAINGRVLAPTYESYSAPCFEEFVANAEAN